MRNITLNTVQGIGDIFWIYQKFAPHVDSLQIRPCVTSLDDKRAKIQARALDFTRTLPKVNRVELRHVSPAVYTTMAQSYFNMSDILAAYDRGDSTEFDYACNYPLEQGIRLEQIDPLEIERTVPLPVEEWSLPYPAKSYVVIYVSGDTVRAAVHLGVWAMPRWNRFLETTCKLFKEKLSVVVIGATYDKAAVNSIVQSCQRLKRAVTPLIDVPLSRIYHVLRNCRLFLGYQSGINILADNFDVPQVMLYYPSLQQLMRAWPKQQNLDNGTHITATFAETDLAIQSRIRELRL